MLVRTLSFLRVLLFILGASATPLSLPAVESTSRNLAVPGSRHDVRAHALGAGAGGVVSIPWHLDPRPLQSMPASGVRLDSAELATSSHSSARLRKLLQVAHHTEQSPKGDEAKAVPRKKPEHGKSDRNSLDKLSPKLKTVLDREVVPVLIRLVDAGDASAFPPGSGFRQAMMADFDSRAEPVLKVLEAHAATKVRKLWLAGVVSAIVRPDGVRALAERDDVASIDLNERATILHEKGAENDQEP